MTSSPTSNPSPKPSVQLLSRSPTISRKPTLSPTVPPSGPTAVPTQKPSKPTSLPSFKPTGPTSSPTVKPSKVTGSPTQILTGYPVNQVDSTGKNAIYSKLPSFRNKLFILQFRFLLLCKITKIRIMH